MNAMIHILMYNAFTTQYTTHKHLKYPEQSSNHHMQKLAKLAKHLEKPLLFT